MCILGGGTYGAPEVAEIHAFVVHSSSLGGASGYDVISCDVSTALITLTTGVVTILIKYGITFEKNPSSHFINCYQ